MSTSSSTPSVALQVSADNILSGGWIVRYTLYDLDHPETITLHLIFGEKTATVQVSGKLQGRAPQGGRAYVADLKSNGLTKLQEILDTIAEQEAWSTSFSAQVVCEKNGSKYLSNQEKMAAPAKPLDKLSISAIRNDQHVYYLRDKHHFEGRLITKVGSRYYFARKGDPKLGEYFETEEINRGMDCTTFVLSIFELRAALAGKDGYDIYTFFGSAAEQVRYSPYEDPQRQVSRLRVEASGKYNADKIDVNVVQLLLDDLAEAQQLYLFACQSHVFYQLGDTYHEFNTNSESGQKMVSGYKTGKIKAKMSEPIQQSRKWSLYRIDKRLPL